MSDAEKETRAAIADMVMDMKQGSRERTAGKALRALNALLTEHRAALSRARAEALEEAAQWFEDSEPGTEWDAAAAASEMRSLVAAPATIPVERVREVLALYAENDNTGVVQAMAELLGVDLDAKGEAPRRGRKCSRCGLAESAHNEVGMRVAVGAATLCLGFTTEDEP